MTLTLLAAALLAHAPSHDEFTVRQVYEGCTRLIRRGAALRHSSLSPEEAMCDAVVTMQLAVLDAQTSLAEDGEAVSRSFCLPDNVLGSAEPALALAEAFIAYVDRNPAVRDSELAQVFDKAMIETWPCPA
ncbi:MAG TPA: Rap1a/Tai family immunity protein [Allosphingosinicella sp.]|nr:Rap1a/Tai family immunity protein [Allosphingosinicella sp.]